MDFLSFRSLPFFANFSESILASLYQLVKIVRYPADAIVLREGEAGDTFFIVCTGELEVRKVIDREQGKYKALTRIGEKEVFGEMAVLDRSARSADVVALTDVVLWKITAVDMTQFLQADPLAAGKFLMAIITLFASRLRATNQAMAVLAETGRIVASASVLPALTQPLFERITHDFEGVDSALLALYNQFNDEFDVVASTPDSAWALPSVLSPSDPLVSFLSQHPEPILIKSVPDHPLELEGAFGRACSLIAAPFYYANTFFGFIVLINWSQPRAFTRQQQVLLHGICQQVAPAMESLRYRSEEAARLRLAKARG